jgi:tRNA dimethylallyltransferase
MNWPTDKIIVICGATATGKSALAIAAAKETNGVIINADSIQVYKDIPILAACPTLADISQVPHKLYNFLDYDQQLSVGKWLQMVHVEIDNCRDVGVVPIIVGGTGMYLGALVNGLNNLPESSSKVKKMVQELIDNMDDEQLHLHLHKCDPAMAQRLHANDHQRIIRALEVFYETGIPLSKLQQSPMQKKFPRAAFYIVHHTLDREKLYHNCNQRFLKMLESGALDEVARLLENYPDMVLKKGIGVKELASYLKNEISLENAVSKAQQATRNYAKRQLTWFRHQLDYDLSYWRS